MLDTTIEDRLAGHHSKDNVVGEHQGARRPDRDRERIASTERHSARAPPQKSQYLWSNEDGHKVDRQIVVPKIEGYGMV